MELRPTKDGGAEVLFDYGERYAVGAAYLERIEREARQGKIAVGNDTDASLQHLVRFSRLVQTPQSTTPVPVDAETLKDLAETVGAFAQNTGNAIVDIANTSGPTYENHALSVRLNSGLAAGRLATQLAQESQVMSIGGLAENIPDLPPTA